MRLLTALMLCISAAVIGGPLGWLMFAVAFADIATLKPGD